GYVQRLPLQRHPLRVVERGTVKRPILPPRLPRPGYRNLLPVQVSDDDPVVGAISDEDALAGHVHRHLPGEEQRAAALTRPGQLELDRPGIEGLLRLVDLDEPRDLLVEVLILSLAGLAIDDLALRV